MASKKSILVYITQSLPREVQATLLHEFNHPQAQGRVDQQSLNRFDLADMSVLGFPVGDIVQLHSQKFGATGSADAAHVHGSFIVVTDDGVSPSSHPKTVLIVKLLDEADGKHQAVRVLASNVAPVLATIENGERGWKDYWSVARVNGGHFPGE